MEQTAKNAKDQTEAVNRRTVRFDEFLKKDRPAPVSAPIDTAVIADIVQKGIADMLSIAMRPKSIIKKWQVNLFPPQDAKLFYKIVFGRWLLYFLALRVVICMYDFSIYWSDNQRDIKLQQLRHDRIIRA